MKKNLFILIIISFITSFILAQNNSVLATGKWYKISTNKNAIYKLDYGNMKNLGVDVSNLLISSIKIYGNGGGMLPELNSDFRHEDLVENAVKIYDANSNGFFEDDDYVIFYGMSPDVWKYNQNTESFSNILHLYSDEVNYFLNIDNQSEGKRIEQKIALQNPTRNITNYNDYAIHEQESENLIQSGRKWFGEQFFTNDNKNFSFTFPDLITSEQVKIKINVVARSFQNSSFNITANSMYLSNVNIPIVSPEYAQEYAKEKSITLLHTPSSSNIVVNLEYTSQDNGAEAWLDYIEVNAKRKLKFNGDFFTFRNTDFFGDAIGQFVIENANNLVVWDISEPNNVKEMSTLNQSNSLVFNDSLNSLNEYIVFSNTSYLTPILKGVIPNQNIRATSSDVEFIIISHPNFISAANRLADFHLVNDNINSIVVTPSKIYNEFSSGMQDVSAIRDFIKFQYDKQDSKLKYLLLFGDGSYDPKDRIEDNTNYIITYQSANSTHPTQSYVTDDYFGLLDDDEGSFINDLVDIGIGRFPASSLSEANILVDKVEQYYQKSSFGSWRNNVVFIADDGDSKDGNTHMMQADTLANRIADKYREINIQKIYLDNYYQESTPGGPRSEATQYAINNTIDKGALLVNYTGHGGPLGWSQERILELDQIQQWDNLDNLPLFMTATCSFSSFDNPDQKSAGEYVLLNESGGAIALLSTTRLVFVVDNFNLNKKFINSLFEQQNGDYPRLGDVFKVTKFLSGTSANNRNFTLLGDPALTLAYPKYSVRTTLISDTLKALSEVNISGEVFDDSGVLDSFNGIIYPTVYDKEIIRSTLGQESCTPMPYRDQNNVIYKGAATIKDGKFSFSFIVPKDIEYNYGSGKISYYAVTDDENLIDANGSEEGFMIGGTADNINYDYDGPEIDLYINDTVFIDGGITDENPILLAHVYDYSGINTVGNGIGHDIIAFLDDDRTTPYILNDFYEAKKDDYRTGVINFPFYNLLPGNHTITLKLWDVFNNSSEKTINFEVVDANQLLIADFIASPNPFSISTDIYFQHNQVNQELDFVLEIYSITGVLVKKIKQSAYNSEGYRIGPINWDAKDDFGRFVSPGLYIANLVVTAENSVFSSKSIRIIILPKYNR